MSASLPFFLVGAGGLLAGELLRLAQAHPELLLKGAFTRAGGERLSNLQPHLGPATELSTTPLGDAAKLLREHLERGPVALFLALPHGETAQTWRSLRLELGPLAERASVVDLSADYRLADPELYARTYKQAHTDVAELKRFRYALPELCSASLRHATRLAAPGCFATALQLACVPAARAGVLDLSATLTLYGITGSSGSGIKPKESTHHPFRNENLFAYGVRGHRHEAELLQSLEPSLTKGQAPKLCFVPHSGPFVRGIHLTACLPLADAIDEAALLQIYTRTYAGKPFVEVLPVDDENLPDLRRVSGSNRAALTVRVRGDQALVLLTLDNVVKGGSGQALQALNLAFGFPEDLGLPRAGLGVV